MRIRSKLGVCAPLASALAFLPQRNPSRSAVTFSKPLKVLILTDTEGVDGIFNEDLECIPDKSPRWDQSRKLLTGEINAAADGLFEAGATDVVVWDGHWNGEKPVLAGYPPQNNPVYGRATRSRRTPPTLP